MGMDVYGNKPRSEAGKYFRENVWGWRPLWAYCSDVAPNLASKVKGAQFNDGDGLGDEDAIALGIELDRRIAKGEHVQAATHFQAEQALMPDEECHICEGTGKRKEPPVVGAGNYPCNGCSETGKRRPFETHYVLRAESVEQFAAFLKDSGGFKIW